MVMCQLPVLHLQNELSEAVRAEFFVFRHANVAELRGNVDLDGTLLPAAHAFCERWHDSAVHAAAPVYVSQDTEE